MTQTASAGWPWTSRARSWDGSLAAPYDGDVWELYPLVVHPHHQRKGSGHPYEFYQKVGFVIVGVMPDANGPGKPDMYMAKRL